MLRSIPPTVWTILALLTFFPGVLPNAVALGLYTGGILGRLVAEARENVDRRPRDALVAAGTPPQLASVAALVPPSTHHLVTYTLYRFEICVRDTAVVGVVGAAGLGRPLSDGLVSFTFAVVSSVLLASVKVSLGSEVLGRAVKVRHPGLRPAHRESGGRTGVRDGPQVPGSLQAHAGTLPRPDGAAESHLDLHPHPRVAADMVELHDHVLVGSGLAYLHDPACQRSSRPLIDEGETFLADQEDGGSLHVRCGRNDELPQA